MEATGIGGHSRAEGVHTDPGTWTLFYGSDKTARRWSLSTMLLLGNITRRALDSDRVPYTIKPPSCRARAVRTPCHCGS
jgi:hypothetical protein